MAMGTLADLEVGHDQLKTHDNPAVTQQGSGCLCSSSSNKSDSWEAAASDDDSDSNGSDGEGEDEWGRGLLLPEKSKIMSFVKEQVKRYLGPS